MPELDHAQLEYLLTRAGLSASAEQTAGLKAAYPHLAREDILACLAYAQDLVSSEKVYPTAAA